MQEVRRANTKKTDEKDPAENANTEVVPLVVKNLEKHMEKEKLENDGKNGIPSSQGTTLVMTGGTPEKKQKMTAAKSKATPKAKTKGSLGNKTKNAKSEKMHNKKKTKIDAKKDAKVKSKKKVLDRAMTVDDVKKKLHAVLRLVGFFPLVIWFVSVSTKFDPNLGLHIDIWPSIITTLQNQCNLIRQTNLHVRIDIIRCTVWKRFILRLTVLDGELANVTSLMIRRNGLPVGVLNVRSAWSVYVLRGSKLPYNMNSKNELEIAWMSRSSRTGLEKKRLHSVLALHAFDMSFLCMLLCTLFHGHCRHFNMLPGNSCVCKTVKRITWQIKKDREQGFGSHYFWTSRTFLMNTQNPKEESNIYTCICESCYIAYRILKIMYI